MKTIFEVSVEKQDGSEEFLDQNNFVLNISEGVTATEMIHGITTLLLTVLAHENQSGNTFTIDGFMRFLTSVMKDSEIGIPAGDSK